MPSGGVFYVASNLGLKSVYRVKALLFTEAEKEIDNDGFVVERGETLYAQKVRFHR